MPSSKTGPKFHFREMKFICFHLRCLCCSTSCFSQLLAAFQFFRSNVLLILSSGVSFFQSFGCSFSTSFSIHVVNRQDSSYDLRLNFQPQSSSCFMLISILHLAAFMQRSSWVFSYVRSSLSALSFSFFSLIS